MKLTITNKTRKWWVLAAMTCSISVIYLDQSVLPVALPTIQRDLNLSELSLQWTINIYLLVLTAFVLAGGRIGDILGHRKVFSWGLIIFAAASIFCGLSQNGSAFIASRALQGLGGALIIPTVPVILSLAFPPEQRGKVFGLYVSIGAFFLSLGPLVGGLLTEYLSWHYVFWINPPIAALALFLTFLSTKASSKQKEPFDYFGFFTLMLGTSGIISALMQGRYWGWGSWPVLTLGIGGVLLIVMLIIYDRKVAAPFIDFSLFHRRTFTVGNTGIFITQFILMLTVFWAIYFQKILGYSPSLAGVWSMVASSPVIIFGSLSGHLYDRYGGKFPLILGFSLVAFSILWFILAPVPSSAWEMLPIVLGYGCGIPLIIIPSFTLYLHGIEARMRGVAIGVSTTLRQLGATAGMAVFGAIFMHQQESSFQKSLAADPSTASLSPQSFEGLLSKASSAVEAVNALPPDTAERVENSVRASTIYASTTINIVGLCITIAALLLVCFYLSWGKGKKAAH